MPKQRVHRVTLVVSFDLACTAQHAAAAVRDCIHGDFFPDQSKYADPTRFRVRGVRQQPRTPRSKP